MLQSQILANLKHLQNKLFFIKKAQFIFLLQKYKWELTLIHNNYSIDNLLSLTTAHETRSNQQAKSTYVIPITSSREFLYILMF